MLQRVARAESLLGYRLAERPLAVSLALELLHRLGRWPQRRERRRMSRRAPFSRA
ncbi:hypothetical protein [Streptomyces sp. NPDC005799]|uniref:hypothetical protein n=1 Tax=Streptomyces sp. NPDC005799 TaxID=3154678 RepID=UPI003406BF57